MEASITLKKVEVMRAFIAGKTIEFSFRGKEDWADHEGEPIWNWQESDYRIKE